MKKIIFLLIIVLFSTLAYAQEDIFNELDAKFAEYEGTKMPGAVKLVFGSERMNIFVDDFKANVITEDGTVLSFEPGHLDDNTMNVYVSEETVRKVLDAENPEEAAKEAYKNKEFKYEGVGAGKKIKLFFVKIAARIASWFM